MSDISINDAFNVKINTDTGQEKENKISTSKYNLLNVLPRLFLEQFSKPANIYFVLIMVLQMIPAISITDGQPLIALPLLMVVSINGAKDYMEDLTRKRSDKEENNRECLVYDKEVGRFKRSKGEDICYGDIVKVQCDGTVPADLILIASSEEDGVANIETKNLDGETNLKFKQACSKLHEHYLSEEDFTRFTGKIVTQPPNELIYEFNGVLEVSEEDKIPLDIGNFLLRGCVLRQTRWVVGVATYCGHDTKIMRNAPKARSKTSRMEDSMNWQIVIISIVQLGFSLLGALYYVYHISGGSEGLEHYIYTEIGYFNTHTLSFFTVRVGTWMLIFSNFVPISLLTTLELVKFCQGKFINWDVEIYDKANKRGVQVQSSGLNEELGQVKYIFSDKTGTLTKNLMEFKKMSIGQAKYGTDTEAEDSEDKYGKISNFNFFDSQFENDKITGENSEIPLFMLCISLCQTVVSDLEGEELLYSASSPDELALVQAARKFGFIFKSRDKKGNIYMEINGEEQVFKLKLLFEYSSDRKRMSVVVEDNTGQAFLFMKGADSKVFEFVEDDSHLEACNAHLTDFAGEGLRTLACAYKKVSKEQLKAMEKEYLQICSSPLDKREKEELFFDQCEKGLKLIGATAIEDKLQDDVGECLESFIKTGIKVWVLTGDKVDTAKSIAFSSKLISNEFNLLEFDAKNSTFSQLEEFKKTATKGKNALIISQEQINQILADKEQSDNLYQLGKKCNAVLCCRVSPKQKAQLVNLVKSREDPVTTLAIGDGANDVNMITSAHIGVGILGVEGRQAARASDYAIGQFSFLKRLLFVHGRESYRKNAYIVCYNFYKNTLFIMPQFWFGFSSVFSGQIIYDNYIYQLYNMVFSVFPIIYYGLFDKEFEFEVLMTETEHYIQGIHNWLFRSVRFWKYCIFGGIQAYFLHEIVQRSVSGPEGPSGRTPDMWSNGSMVYAGVVLMANLKVGMNSFSHNFVSVGLLLLSVTAYFLILWLMSMFTMFSNFGNFYMIYKNIDFYLAMALFLMGCVILDWCTKRLFISYGLYVRKVPEEYLPEEPPVEIKKIAYKGAAFSCEDTAKDLNAAKILRSISINV